MMKNIRSLIEIPSAREYMQSIGAEPRSLLKAVVKESAGKYWRDVAVISFDRDGKVSAPDDYLPSEDQQAAMLAEFPEYEFPSQVNVAKNAKLPDLAGEAGPENTYKFFSESGEEIIFIQIRTETEEGKRSYLPYTYWSDGGWRRAEPEGKLPLFGLETLQDNSTVFIHEGAKAAKAMQRLANPKTKEERDRAAAHPWSEELSGAAHVGWVGGALSPSRTDWGVLKKAGIKRAYIVSDNDIPGLQAVPKISKQLRIPTFHIQFTNEWPASFDLADDFPAKMFDKIESSRHYIGPSFRSCLHPATWATDTIPNQRGRPTPVLRSHFREMWAYVEEADLWVCRDMPDIVRTEMIADKMLSAFSDSSSTTKLLLRSYQGRSAKICYRPDVAGRIVTDRSTSAINLHMPSNIRPKEGNPAPWLDFLEYMFPSPAERKNVERWCATLIARPDVRMEYGLLLVSEAQGVGKTTLGSEILGKLVGDHNVGCPSEKTITEGVFTDWIAQKRLIVVNEIYSGHSWKAYNTLKSYITDREVTINAKFQRPYKIDNWAHIVACSNSMKALRMEEDDRRWFYPSLTECRWPPEKFREFHKWIGSGGLAIVAYWAKNYGDYVKAGERSPMTDRKKELIAESRTEAQTEVAALAEAVAKMNSPVALLMKDVEFWVRTVVQGRVFDSSYDLRKVMKRSGLFQAGNRVFLRNRQQYALVNAGLFREVNGLSGSDLTEALKPHLRKPDEIFEREI